MKKKRLFAAIDLPKEVQEKLQEFQDEWRHFPARWVKPENIHLTLNFLGYVEEGNVASVADAVNKAVQSFAPFSFEITRINYGPNDFNPGGKYPRMIWARIGEGTKLIALQQSISSELQNLPFHIHQEIKSFNPHLTLCRFNSFHLREWEGGDLPDVATQFEEEIDVQGVKLMESKLKRGGAEYFVIESIRL